MGKSVFVLSVPSPCYIIALTQNELPFLWLFLLSLRWKMR